MKRFLPVFVILAAVAAAGWLSQRPVQTQPATSYDALVKLYGDMRASQRPADVKGVPDYSATAVQARRKALDDLRASRSTPSTPARGSDRNALTTCWSSRSGAPSISSFAC